MLTLRHIFAIAKNTFRETIRDRVLYAILVFSLAFLGFTLVISSISLGTDLHIMRSLGLAGMYLFSVIITVFLGTSLIYKEIEKRTLYFILAKPISRAEVIIGKFFGRPSRRSRVRVIISFFNRGYVISKCVLGK